MESRIQEKEFKIMTLKNQIKHMPFGGLSTNSGLMTPMTPLGSGYNPSKNYSQNELFHLINTMV